MFNITNVLYDQDKVKNGVWVDYKDGAKVKLVSLLDREFNLNQKQYRDKYKDDDELFPIDYMTMFAESASESLIKDWSGFCQEDKDGKQIEIKQYDKALAKQMLIDSLHFSQFIKDKANDLSLFKIKQQEEILGNSPNTSPGA